MLVSGVGGQAAGSRPRFPGSAGASQQIHDEFRAKSGLRRVEADMEREPPLVSLGRHDRPASISAFIAK